MQNQRAYQEKDRAAGEDGPFLTSCERVEETFGQCVWRSLGVTAKHEDI